MLAPFIKVWFCKHKVCSCSYVCLSTKSVMSKEAPNNMESVDIGSRDEEAQQTMQFEKGEAHTVAERCEIGVRCFTS